MATSNSQFLCNMNSNSGKVPCHIDKLSEERVARLFPKNYISCRNIPITKLFNQVKSKICIPFLWLITESAVT